MSRNYFYVLLFATFALLTILNVVSYLPICDEKSEISRLSKDDYSQIDVAQRTTTAYNIIPLLYIITPTVQRLEQKADLTRLSNTLRHVPRLLWVVIEDAANKGGMITRLLKNCKLPYTHLNAKTPVGDAARQLYNFSHVPHRGVLQRNTGLDWVLTNAEFPSVLYFADDDNTYDLQLFEEMRYAQKIAVWPAGLLGGAKYQTPAVMNGKVSCWLDKCLYAIEKFACDMASFAVKTEFYMNAGRPQFNITEPGIIETDFLKRFHITLDDLEPKADNCTKVLVWHTRTQRSSLAGTRVLDELRSKYSEPELEI